jgi:hypothetical protein
MSLFQIIIGVDVYVSCCLVFVSVFELHSLVFVTDPTQEIDIEMIPK